MFELEQQSTVLEDHQHQLIEAVAQDLGGVHNFTHLVAPPAHRALSNVVHMLVHLHQWLGPVDAIYHVPSLCVRELASRQYAVRHFDRLRVGLAPSQDTQAEVDLELNYLDANRNPALLAQTKKLPNIDGIRSPRRPPVSSVSRVHSEDCCMQPPAAEPHHATRPAPRSLIGCPWHPLHSTCAPSGFREKDDEVCQALDWGSKSAIDHGTWHVFLCLHVTNSC